MEYAIYITLDKNVENDYCFLSSNAYDENTVNLNVYTNGKNQIDFQKMDYVTLEARHYKNFITYFSYGRNVIGNAKVIHISNTTENLKNTKKENREIMKFLNINKELLNKKIYIDVGQIKLNEEDLDLLTPIKKCKYAVVTFDETGIFHYIDELEDIHELVNEIVRKVNKHDFSPLEKMLYAYDIIRTDFMGNKEYENKMAKVLKIYTEPSFCYALMYREVLNRLDIKNEYAYGDFKYDSRRAFNIAYVKDEEYEIEGVYYFDIANDSKQRFNNSIEALESTDIHDGLINNYEFFCKTKGLVFERGNLFEDCTFGDFDEEFMDIYNFAVEKEGINGVFKLRPLINLISNFIDGKDLINSFRGIKDEEELEEVKEETERYVKLFSNDIDGEDFLEMLFNVRTVEYMENKELFPLNIDALKKCIYNSQFALSNMMLEFSQDREYEQEDIDEILQETFDNSFEEVSSNKNLEDRIKKLKLTLNKNKDVNKPNNGDNK